MVRFTRTFHTVGQGAFYSEKIEYNDKQVFRMVYDCGSKSIPESLLAKRIKSELDLTAQGLGKLQVRQQPNFQPTELRLLNDKRLQRFLARFE